MNVWKLTAANTLSETKEELKPEEGKLRIRVTKVFVNGDDALIFKGAKKIKYPLIPGRYAVGLAADDSVYPKGTRLLLHVMTKVRETGTEKTDYNAADTLIRGLTTDGYLRDFVYAPLSDVTPLPEAVSDEKALLIQHVAYAKAAVETLGIQKGEHIAVIGGDMLGFFVCQLLIYQQAAPILVDIRKDRLEFARGNGIYYTALSDDTLTDVIGTVTGGRLADGVVCIVDCANAYRQNIPMKICAPGEGIAYCGQGCGNDCSLPLDDLLCKRLTAYGVYDGSDYIETAINLIATKTVDLSAFRANILQPKDLPDLFADYARRPERNVNELNVINLV